MEKSEDNANNLFENLQSEARESDRSFEKAEVRSKESEGILRKTLERASLGQKESSSKGPAWRLERGLDIKGYVIKFTALTLGKEGPMPKGCTPNWGAWGSLLDR